MIAMDDNIDDTGGDDSDDDNNHDNNAGDNASSTTSDEGDNHNRNNGEEACASMATMPRHWRRLQHWQRVLSCGRGQGNKIILSVNNISSYDPWLAIFWNERK